MNTVRVFVEERFPNPPLVGALPERRQALRAPDQRLLRERRAAAQIGGELTLGLRGAAHTEQ